MFHFPTFPPHALCVQARVTPHDWCGVPPFGNPRINARLTAPRGLSQPPTSFIGSWCQGIHRAPLTTWPHKNRPLLHHKGFRNGRAYTNSCYRVRRCSRPLCSSQRPTRHRPPDPTRPSTPHGAPGGMRYRPALTREATIHPHSGRGPLSQDPTARLRPHPANQTPVHATPVANDEETVLGARIREPAELVSVPPSSTTPGTARPSGTDGRRVLGAALDHQHEAGGQCSLERR